VRNLQPADKRECRDFLTTVVNLGELTLEEADVRREGVTLSHFDREKVVVVLLGFLAKGALVRNTLVTSSKLQRERGGRE